MANLSSSNIDPSLVGPIKIVDGDNPVDAVIPSGNVGIGVQPTEKLSVQGVIESKTGGIKFPDATVQTTAASGGGASSQVRVIKFIDSNGTEHTTQEFIDNWINPTKVSDNAMAEGRNVVSWSLNDDYLAVGGAGVPNLRIYKKTGINTFIELSNMPAGMSDTNNTKGLAWDPTGTYLAVASDSLPNLRIYKRVGDSFTELTSIDVQPTPNALCISWSSDGVLAVGGGFLEIWTRSGDNFTKQADPTPALGDPADDIEWDPTGEFLSVAISASNAFSTMEIYQKTGVSTLTRLPTPTGVIIGPGQRGLTTTWSPNGLYVAFGTRNGGSNGIRIFKKSGTTFTNITANLDTLPTSDTNGLAFSPDGKQFAYADNTVPYVTIFDIVNDIFTKTSDLPAITANGFGGNVKAEIAWGNNGKYFVNTNTTGFSIYSSAFELSLPAQTEITDVLDLGQIETSTEKVVDVSITKFTDSNGVSHSTQTILEQWLNPTKLLDLTNNGIAQKVSWLYDDTLVVVSAGLKIFSVVNDVFTALPNSNVPDISNVANVEAAEFSPNGKFLALYENNIGFKVYKRDGHTFTRVAPSISASGTGSVNIRWSPDSELLVVTSGSTGISFTYFQVIGDTFTQLTSPAFSWGPNTMPMDAAWSPNGEFLAVSFLAPDSAADKAKLAIIQRSGTTLTQLPDPPGVPIHWSVSALGIGWSQDSQFLCMGLSTPPFLMMFKRSGTTFTIITSIDQYPTSRVSGVAWGRSGKNLVLYQQTSPLLLSYSQSGSTFTRTTDLPSLGNQAISGFIALEAKFGNTGRYLTTPQSGGYAVYKTEEQALTLPSKPNIQKVLELGTIDTEKVIDVSITKFTDSNGVSHSTQTLITPWTSPTKLLDFETSPARERDQAEWTPNGKYLALGGPNSGGRPFISIWKKTGDTMSEITNLPASMLAVGLSYDVTWSPDGNYLMGASDVVPYFYWYKRNGDTFTELPTPTLPGFTNLNSIDESIEGLVMLASEGPLDILYLFQRVNDTLTQLTNPPSVGGTAPREVQWSNNGKFIAVSRRLNGFRVYLKSGTDTLTTLQDFTLGGGINFAESFAWSPNDEFLLVSVTGNTTSQRIFLYSVSGTTFTDVTILLDIFPDSTNFPTGTTASGAAWSPDGKTFAFNFNSGAQSYTYTWDGTSFVQDPILPGIIGTSATGQFRWVLSGEHLIRTADVGISLYKTSSTISLPAKTNVLAISDLGTIPSVELEKRIATATDITTSGRGIYAVTDTSIARSITLSTQDSLFEGNLITIKDESGLASVNNITILTEGAETIDGLASVLISTNFGSIKLYSNGIDWFIF